MLTELEHTVLGVVALDQPVTAYAVRGIFARSLSSHWSSSAGSIYPAIERLAKRKLIRSSPRAGDGRGTSLYSVTARGRKVLNVWLLPPLPDGAALMANDPLRTRVRFLALIGRDDAVRALKEARQNLSAQLARIPEQLKKPKSKKPIVRAVHRGAELSIRAQLKWIDELIAEANDIFDS